MAKLRTKDCVKFYFYSAGPKKPNWSFIVRLLGLTVSINHRLMLQSQSKPGVAALCY